ncbi:oligosaccharide repeat unit polymerase [Yoonia sediminilitoris]|uniref:Oligosaccharide repeat unit polymerase n=1 Tax=Yoonia sediminilitoris TaxID=1286148 RepID=A0A2T6KBD2_9RHOB|nr:oligosaccharide repeat unit polymerase [Yoonia sediminilitoris]PUB12127.1 oligosaccharide repeat unit polymerase [Yoonia sediminilitoris]RCW92954.1 oligosaccharide repeat unit polymerase [Yoonia sediminilitoris]
MENLLIIALGVLACWVPLVLGQRHGIIRLVSPMHLVAYFCFFGFLLKVSTYAIFPQFAFFRRFVENSWGDQLGALYLTLFVLMLCAGYRVACARTSRADAAAAARIMAGHIQGTGWLVAVAVGFAAGTIAVILQARGVSALDPGVVTALNSDKQINVNANGVGATLAGIKTFFIVPKCAFVMLLAHAIVTGSRWIAALALCLGGLLVFIALLSGDRFELVELMIFALATAMILGMRLSARRLVPAGVALLCLGAVSGYMTQLRLGVEIGSTSGLLLRQIVGSTYFLDINAAVMVTDRVETGQMLLGQSYGWWSFGWVPRAIWIDKPAIDLGAFFKREVMQVYTGGAHNVTGPGEAYINFGWAGVCVGFILGWVYRKGEEFLLSPLAAFRQGAFVFYPLVFYPFVQATLQSSFSAFIVGAAAQSVLIIAMIRIFMVRYALWIPPFHQNRSRLYVA